MRYAEKKDDVPSTPHYAIVEFSSMLIPGDERPRTNPGHGHPEHTEAISRYITFGLQEEWEAEIKKRIGLGQSNFVALLANPAAVRTAIVVDIGSRPKVIDSRV